MNLFSIGNLKLGKDTMIFNMAPAHDCQSKRMGLCKVGKACYAMKAEKCYPNVLPFRQRQAAFWTSCTVDEFVEAVSQKKTKGIKYLRVNESGDFRNQADVDKLNEIAKILKEKYDINTYLYTARSDLTFKDTHFVVNGSSWMADNNFKFIPKGQEYKGKYVCPGDCRTCNLCKQKLGIEIGIKQH